MREFIIDFSQENPFPNGTDAGQMGENNATTLVIRPGDEILNSGCASFAIVFLSKGVIYRSEHFKPADEFRMLLGEHLTQDHYLSIQIEGYSEENNVLFKSPMVSNIQFSPSIKGKEGTIDPSDYQLKAQISLNTQARHTHPEKKTVILSYDKGEFETYMVTANFPRIDFYSYEEIENFVVPQDAEIVSVRMKFKEEDFAEWIDLRDMINYDTKNPYIISMHKTVADIELGSTVFCRIHFLKNVNALTAKNIIIIKKEFHIHPIIFTISV